MERFLQSLSPRLRGEVEATLSDVENRQRLEMVASRYIDEDGSWPTNTMTAESLAREYLNLISVRASFHRGAGLAPATAAALAGGVLTIAAGEGAVVLSSRLMNTYWRDMVAYSTGLNPYMVRTLTNVVRTVSQGTPWEEMVRTWTKDRTRSPASLFLGDNFPRLLERELFGVFRAVALRGARSAAQHVGVPVDEFATNEWVSSNVARFAQAQWSISDRSLRYILNVMETDDLSPRVTGERIRQTWYLSPRHTRAVENYRSGLSQQDRTARSVNQMVRSYAQRLANTRSQMIANTETARLFSAARENYWTQMVQQGQMPLGTKKMWVTAQDELVCRHCSPLDGEVAEFSQPFRNSDIGVHFPPVHPNCRCIIIPVEPDETVPDVSIMVYSPEQMVSKRTIIVPEYERADGTTVRRHRRVIGESDAMERWQEAQPTEEHAAIAKLMNTFTHDMRLPGEKFVWEDDPKKALARMASARTRVANSQREQLSEVASDDLVKSVVRGSRIWTTVTGGIGLVREVAGLTAPGHIDSSQYATENTKWKKKKWRESEIRAASDFVNAVRSSPSVDRSFYRGIDVPLDTDLYDSFAPGTQVNLPVSSLSEHMSVASRFVSSTNKPVASVLFRFEPGTRAMQLPNALVNPLHFEDEWVTSGLFEVASVSKSDNHTNLWYVSLVQKGEDDIAKSKYVVEMIEDKLCTPLRVDREDDISKRTIIVPEYERADGTLVREHRRFVRGELPHAKTGFVSYLDAMKSDAEYRLSTPGWETMEKLGRKLRRLGYNWDNTHPNASRRRHIFTTTGSRSALFADNDRNIAARVGSHYHGSPASNPYIRGVQDAAKRIFGLDDASTAHFAPQTASSRDYIANAFGGLGYEPYVRAQMDVTQRHLAERGIEEVSVMRGMRMSRSDVEDLGISVVERRPRRRSRGSIWHTMTFQSQPLNSVTTSPIIASRYATGITGSLRDDDVAVIMRRRTPANEVFANYKTGLGMQRWQEWVTLGGRQEWEVIAIDPDLIATNIGPLRRAGITPGRRRQMTIEEIWNS